MPFHNVLATNLKFPRGQVCFRKYWKWMIFIYKNLEILKPGDICTGMRDGLHLTSIYQIHSLGFGRLQAIETCVCVCCLIVIYLVFFYILMILYFCIFLSVKHNGNLTFDDILGVARIMRERSMSKTLAGTCKEILGLLKIFIILHFGWFIFQKRKDSWVRWLTMFFYYVKSGNFVPWLWAFILPF